MGLWAGIFFFQFLSILISSVRMNNICCSSKIFFEGHPVLPTHLSGFWGRVIENSRKDTWECIQWNTKIGYSQYNQDYRWWPGRVTEAMGIFPGIHWEGMKLRNFCSWNTTPPLGCPKSITWKFDFACASGLDPKKITKIKSRGKVLFFSVRDQLPHFWIKFGRLWFPPTSEALAEDSLAAAETQEPGHWLYWQQGTGRLGLCDQPWVTWSPNENSGCLRI